MKDAVGGDYSRNKCGNIVNQGKFKEQSKNKAKNKVKQRL